LRCAKAAFDRLGTSSISLGSGFNGADPRALAYAILVRVVGMKREAASLLILVGGDNLRISAKVFAEGEMAGDVRRIDAVAV
jgi:hypothetical protein